ncbi:MAG: HRDC domain-containing protein [Deltaproteobacteria bacterium]|nr:HRDC domain-containing protein [Deltaproteobacteria bacterium]MDQ3295644.1 HRDC domain-containing protein [Myxococcota bacterium]
MSDETRWIRTADDLDDLVHELARHRAIGFDTEADSLHHYTEKVCLLQLTAFGGPSWLVDPLALEDLSSLAPIFADPTVLKVVHGGDNDVTTMRRDFGFTFRTLFDTSVAGRLLGDTELGLQAMVRNELGIELTKGSQKDDWSKRPLTSKQEAYALADVAYLMELAARLTARLAAAERTEWAREEFAVLESLPPAKKRSGPDEFRRIKGSAKLSRRQQAVLRELYAWREERAAAADRPPFKIVGPEVLLELAEQSPTTADEVARALSSYSRQSGQVEVVLAAIERGLAMPEAELPTREPREHKSISAAAHRRFDALRTWRDEQATRTGLDPSIVLPLRLIERLALAAPQTLAELAEVEGVRRWRVAEWGTALLATCAARQQDLGLASSGPSLTAR